MQTAKVFENGRSQAVRIPKEYRFDDDEVFINRVGSAVILVPKSEVKDVFYRGLNSFPDDFLEDGRPEQIPTVREEF